MLYCSACRGAILYTGRQAKVAQLVEHSTENAGVVGSIPSLGTFYFWHTVSSLIESGRRQFYFMPKSKNVATSVATGNYKKNECFCTSFRTLASQ